VLAIGAECDERHTPDPMLIRQRRRVMGAIPHQGLTADTVDVSDDAGQFRVARTHCAGYMPNVSSISWFRQRTAAHAIEIAKRMIWWFYHA